MSERDRLATLLERATRERQANAEEDGAAARPGSAGHGEGITGGEWLPSAPPDGARHRAERSGPRLLTWPAALRSVRLSVRPTAVVGVLVVALLAAGIFGIRWWRAEQASEPVPVVSRQMQQLTSGSDESMVTAGTAGETADPNAAVGARTGTPPTLQPAPGSGPEATDRSSDAASEELLVHVAGQVRAPGVVRLAAGARVLDAVDEAGGLTADADTSRVNLARPVADGERIWVPRPGEDVPELAESPTDGREAGGPGQGTDGAVPSGAPRPVNLNSADQSGLEELPGVGPVTAAAILQWRTEHGRFSSPDELLEVSGIGEATLEKLRPHVTL